VRRHGDVVGAVEVRAVLIGGRFTAKIVLSVIRFAAGS